jgi:hypothetical protein
VLMMLFTASSAMRRLSGWDGSKLCITAFAASVVTSEDLRGMTCSASDANVVRRMALRKRAA